MGRLYLGAAPGWITVVVLGAFTGARGLSCPYRRPLTLIGRLRRLRQPPIPLRVSLSTVISACGSSLQPKLPQNLLQPACWVVLLCCADYNCTCLVAGGRSYD